MELSISRSREAVNIGNDRGHLFIGHLKLRHLTVRCYNPSCNRLPQLEQSMSLINVTEFWGVLVRTKSLGCHTVAAAAVFPRQGLTLANALFRFNPDRGLSAKPL